MAGIHDGADEPDDGRMGRLIKMADPFVQPVDRNRVLDEIVGTDAEEIDLPREYVGDDRRARDLDHRADFHVLVERDPFVAQLLAALLKDPVGAPQLIHPGDHRVHHAHVSDGAGSQNGAQLGLEDIDPLQTKPNGAPSQERIELLGKIERAHELIASQIERANDDAVRAHFLRNLAIGTILILLVWKLGAVEIEKLGPVKADPFRAAQLHLVDILRQLDVRRKDDVPSIEGGRFGFTQLGELLLDLGLFGFELAVFPKRLITRINNDQSVVTVEQDMIAGDQLVADIMQTHDRRNIQRPRHDGGMRGLAADIGGKPHHQRAVELRGVRGGQIMRDEDVRRGDAGEVTAPFAHQIMDHAAGDIMDIQRPFPQVRVVDLAQGLRVTSGHRAEDMLDVVPVALEGAQHLVNEGAILHHQQMGVKNTRVLGADRFGDPFLKLEDLDAGGNQRRFEAGDFAGNFVFLDPADQGQFVVGAINKDAPAGDSRRDTNAVKSPLGTRRRGLIDHRWKSTVANESRLAIPKSW